MPGGGHITTGPAVVLSGTVTVEGWTRGEVRLDVFDGDQRDITATRRPSVVAVGRLEKPGAFEIRVPESAGYVWLGGFVDVDGDGRPGPGDPSGWYTGNPVSIDGDVSGLELTLAPPKAPPSGAMQ